MWVICMENKKWVIALSVAAGGLAVCLIVLSVFVAVSYHKNGGDTGESSSVQTSGTDESFSADDISYDASASDPKESTQESTAPLQTTAEEIFQEVNEQVTAKREVNLRSSMDQGTDDNIVHCLANGEIAVRTGIGKNGWSRVVYNSQTLYCISNYLTADLNYVPPAEETDPFKTKFAPVNEKVTAKEITNLRDRPSVLEPSQVVIELNHGEVAVRTGIANEGWSRVEYNGQVLYCISSYLEIVEE